MVKAKGNPLRYPNQDSAIHVAHQYWTLSSTRIFTAKMLLLNSLLLLAATARASVLTLHVPRVAITDSTGEGLRTEVYVSPTIQRSIIYSSQSQAHGEAKNPTHRRAHRHPQADVPGRRGERK